MRPSADPSRLRFRLPARTDVLGGWLARLLPGLDRRARRAWIAEGRISVGGRVQDRADRSLPPGAWVEIDLPSEPPGEGLEIGWPGEPPGAGEARRDRASGPGSEAGSPASRWWAWIEDTPWWRGGLAALGAGAAEEDASLEAATFEVERREAGYARVRIEGEPLEAVAVLEGLARIGLPVVGDLRRGGLAVSGGPVLADSPASLSRPMEPVWRPAYGEDALVGAPKGDQGTLRVSDETARALAAGHPWILPDEASDPTSGHRPGALVRILDRRGEPLAWAHVEGTARLAARVWATQGETPRDLPSVDARVARALARRRAGLAADPVAGDNTVRLIHGEADGLPGLYVDRLGALLRVLVSGWATEGFRVRALEALQRQLPLSPEGHAWSVLELLHLRGPASHAVDRVRWIEGGAERLREAHPDLDAKGFVVRERGLDYWIDPGWDAPRRPRPGYGLFLDQRDNRDRVARRAVDGGRWLNLFAHTGAFSVALLAAGAEEVISVDLSAAYLRRLEDNLVRNHDQGVDPARHRSARGEVRRVVEALDPGLRFRGIVLDPPTAAAAGRRFWSVGDDLEPLLSSCLARLEPGGCLLVSQNRAGPPLGLDRVLERLARRAHRAIGSLVPAPPGEDHPSLPGFPEGDPFEGWLLDLR